MIYFKFIIRESIKTRERKKYCVCVCGIEGVHCSYRIEWEKKTTEWKTIKGRDKSDKIKWENRATGVITLVCVAYTDYFTFWPLRLQPIPNRIWGLWKMDNVWRSSLWRLSEICKFKSPLFVVFVFFFNSNLCNSNDLH